MAMICFIVGWGRCPARSCDPCTLYRSAPGTIRQSPVSSRIDGGTDRCDWCKRGRQTIRSSAAQPIERWPIAWRSTGRRWTDPWAHSTSSWMDARRAHLGDSRIWSCESGWSTRRPSRWGSPACRATWQDTFHTWLASSTSLGCDKTVWHRGQHTRSPADLRHHQRRGRVLDWVWRTVRWDDQPEWTVDQLGIDRSSQIHRDRCDGRSSRRVVRQYWRKDGWRGSWCTALQAVCKGTDRCRSRRGLGVADRPWDHLGIPMVLGRRRWRFLANLIKRMDDTVSLATYYS